MSTFRSACLLVRRAIVLPLLVAGSAFAQSAKKPITQDVYDIWRGISGATLSSDGRWAMYTVSPVVGEGEVFIRSTSGITESRHPGGSPGGPQTRVPPAGGGGGPGFTVQAAQFSGDSRFAVFLRYPTQAEVEAARRAPRGRGGAGGGGAGGGGGGKVSRL